MDFSIFSKIFKKILNCSSSEIVKELSEAITNTKIKYLEEIKTFQGAIASSATNFVKFLKLDEAINLNLEQIYIYSYQHLIYCY